MCKGWAYEQWSYVLGMGILAVVMCKGWAYGQWPCVRDGRMGSLWAAHGKQLLLACWPVM